MERFGSLENSVILGKLEGNRREPPVRWMALSIAVMGALLEGQADQISLMKIYLPGG